MYLFVPLSDLNSLSPDNLKMSDLNKDFHSVAENDKPVSFGNFFLLKGAFSKGTAAKIEQKNQLPGILLLLFQLAVRSVDFHERTGISSLAGHLIRLYVCIRS